jgi:TDG/mug DNA glycosylase family protein
MTRPMLDDLLQPNLKIVFCGTAAGKISAARGQYYAKPNNRFWQVLHEVGLTPRKLSPKECQEVVQHGIGLTDLVKYASGMDRDLQDQDYDVPRFNELMIRYSPDVIAFNGKKAAAKFFQRSKPKIKYGKQTETLDKIVIFVLPSTSGANGWWEKRRHYEHWLALADFVKS